MALTLRLFFSHVARNSLLFDIISQQQDQHRFECEPLHAMSVEDEILLKKHFMYISRLCLQTYKMLYYLHNIDIYHPIPVT